jgi:hypothetical protein
VEALIFYLVTRHGASSVFWATARATRRTGPCSAMVIGLFFAICFCSGGQLYSQETETDIINREYRIKAAYIYRFSQYIDWPADSFPDASSPFLIGVFTDDPVTADLLQIAQTKKFQERSIEIRRCTANSNLAACQILFLPSTIPQQTQTEVAQRTVGKHVLLVGEGVGALSNGCSISFVIEENKVRLYIARKMVERQGLTVSAKLLQVSHIVD